MRGHCAAIMKALMILISLAAFASMIVCIEREAEEQFKIICMFEANVTETELKNFHIKGRRASDASQNIRCLMKCLMEKEGTLDNGVYNTTRAIQAMTSVPELKGREDEIKEAINTCKTEKGVDECDTAFKITMCIYEFKSRIQ